MWSPDARYIVTRSVPGKGSSTGDLCIWNAANGVMVHTLPNVPGDLIFSQDGRRILLHDQTNTHSVSVFDLDTGLSIFVTPKGAQVAQASFLGGDRLLLLNYQSSEKEAFHSFVLELPGGRELYRLSQGTNSFIAVASPDGSAYLVVGVDPRIYLFDSATGRKLNTYTEPHTFDAPVFTRDGKRIGIYSGQSCTFVDVATGRETLTIPLADGPDRAIHFSPHGSMMYRLPQQTDVATSGLHAWDLRSHPDD